MSRVALFSHNDEVRASLKSAFDSQMRRLVSHKTDKVPVLDSRSTVSEHVSDKLRVNLCGRVKTNCSLKISMIDISINRRWHDNNSGRDLLFEEEV